MSEDQLLRKVLELARKYNVVAFHSYDSKRDTVKGWPDLVLVGQNGVAFVELKSSGGEMSREQTILCHKLRAAGQEWHLWRPSDLEDGTIKEILESL